MQLSHPGAGLHPRNSSAIPLQIRLQSSFSVASQPSGDVVSAVGAGLRGAKEITEFVWLLSQGLWASAVRSLLQKRL